VPALGHFIETAHTKLKSIGAADDGDKFDVVVLAKETDEQVKERNIKDNVWKVRHAPCAELALQCPPMLAKVAFTMYPIKDTARARVFYEGTVGSHAPSGIWTEYDLPGGGGLALFKTDCLQPSANAGGSVAFEVDDLDALLAKLEAQGVQIKERMIHSPVCRMSVVLDSEGNSLILHQVKQR